MPMTRRLAFALVLLAACGRATPSIAGRPVSTASLSGSQGAVTVHVEAADSPAERERGLMGRTALPADAGMVFLFADEGATVTDRFWMKDTEIALSIAFWGTDGRILAIYDMDPCATDPCPTYGPPAPYVGALEVNKGFFSEHGVHVGDRIQLS